MTLVLRRAEERGKASLGWLESRHTFSFGHYYDPRHMGYGPLRVINDDRVAPGGGFAPHPHSDMEIVSYVLEGALEHRDSLGSGSVIRPGDVQRMSAGTGIRHSEFNASQSSPVHFLQIWIEPEARGLAPGYEQKQFDRTEQYGTLRLVGSRDGRSGSVTIHRDVNLYTALLDGDQQVVHRLTPGRAAWIHVARGAVSVNGTSLSVGDGLAVADVPKLVLADAKSAEILLFDMAM